MTESRSTESVNNSASTSTSRHWTPVSHAKFEVEKFDGSSNIGMRRCEVKDMLVQMNQHFTLRDKPDDLDELEWARANRKACSSIRLCLATEEKYAFTEYEIAKKLWKALEDKFMTMSIENRLYLRKMLFSLDYIKGISIN